MFSKLVIPVGAMMILASGVATASPDEYEDYYRAKGPVPFEVLDVDGDGVVTAGEHARVHEERRAARQAEGRKMSKQHHKPNFEQMDADGNGAISRQELDDWHANRMKNCDRKMRYSDD